MTGFLFGEPHFSVAVSFRGSRSSRRGIRHSRSSSSRTRSLDECHAAFWLVEHHECKLELPLTTKDNHGHHSFHRAIPAATILVQFGL